MAYDNYDNYEDYNDYEEDYDDYDEYEYDEREYLYYELNNPLLPSATELDNNFNLQTKHDEYYQEVVKMFERNIPSRYYDDDMMYYDPWFDETAHEYDEVPLITDVNEAEQLIRSALNANTEDVYINNRLYEIYDSLSDDIRKNPNDMLQLIKVHDYAFHEADETLRKSVDFVAKAVESSRWVYDDLSKTMQTNPSVVDAYRHALLKEETIDIGINTNAPLQQLIGGQDYKGYEQIFEHIITNPEIDSPTDPAIYMMMIAKNHCFGFGQLQLDKEELQKAELRVYEKNKDMLLTQANGAGGTIARSRLVEFGQKYGLEMPKEWIVEKNREYVNQVKTSINEMKRNPSNTLESVQDVATAIRAVGWDGLSKEVNIEQFFKNVGQVLATNEINNLRQPEELCNDGFMYNVVKSLSIPGHEQNVVNLVQQGFEARISEEPGINYDGDWQIKEELPTIKELTENAMKIIGADEYVTNPYDFWEMLGTMKSRMENGELSDREAEKLQNALESDVFKAAYDSPHKAFIEHCENIGSKINMEWKMDGRDRFDD